MKAGLLSLVALAAIALPLRGDGEETRAFLLRAFAEAPSATKQPPIDDVDATNEAKLTIALAYAFYRNLLSSQDGDRCSFTPSCSRYARLAIARYGLLRGMVMAADRLQRCHGRDRDDYPLDRASGRLYDPLP